MEILLYKRNKYNLLTLKWCTTYYIRPFITSQHGLFLLCFTTISAQSSIPNPVSISVFLMVLRKMVLRIVNLVFFLLNFKSL